MISFEKCDDCEKPRSSVRHRHDSAWCNGEACGAWLCDNCADAASEAYSEARMEAFYDCG